MSETNTEEKTIPIEAVQELAASNTATNTEAPKLGNNQVQVNVDYFSSK